jgi:hypothetical protein
VRIAESKRRYRRQRRDLQKTARRLAAGHLKKIDLKSGYFLMPCPVPCVHCGAEFQPQRSSARYCGARCRVAAHRAKR